jgi:hypothetical protein
MEKSNQIMQDRGEKWQPEDKRIREFEGITITVVADSS